MSVPAVSVIVPTYNRAAKLREAVAALRGASVGIDIEIVIVDDGSTDDTPRVIGTLEGVRALAQPNAGPAAARNAGLAAATAPRIAFRDDDDLAVPGGLAALRNALDADPGAAAAVGLSTFDAPGSSVPGGEPRLMYHLGAALFRRDLFDRIGGFDPSLHASEDADLFLRIRDAGERIAPVHTLVQILRRHDGNMTAGRGLKELDFMQVLKRSLDRRRGSK